MNDSDLKRLIDQLLPALEKKLAKPSPISTPTLTLSQDVSIWCQSSWTDPKMLASVLPSEREKNNINSCVLIRTENDQKKSIFAYEVNGAWAVRCINWKDVPAKLQIIPIKNKKISDKITHQTFIDLKKSSQLLGARTPEGIITEVFGENGDKAAPPFTFTDGFTPPYSTAGPPYPERTSFNFLYNALYALAFDTNRMGGALQWDTAITYEQYAVVVGTDGNLYIAVISQAGNDPVGDTGTNWIMVPSRAEVTALQDFDTLLQSNSGAAQIGTASGSNVQQELDSRTGNIIVSCRTLDDNATQIIANVNVAFITNQPSDEFMINYTTPLTTVEYVAGGVAEDFTANLIVVDLQPNFAVVRTLDNNGAQLKRPFSFFLIGV